MTLDLSSIKNPFAPVSVDDCLSDPNFWRTFIQRCDYDADRIISEIKLLRANISEERVMRRFQSYVRGRIAEIDLRIHPGSRAIN
jgi:hypothetical protein